ncbi:hypothetical protein [Cytobacillus oceanisediminis]|uniref:Uncharacterized protein n=1 Tax=Cytobacillus oceanisediminis TaxID=665099 RepID=A0ABX3D080_9BACI|nr:hypothetical protein [Cytobacillus oceanisediminis]OHX50696.1 hypothetical protein BBV17_06660 [Cytobacillus oceanisediminis]
MDAISAKCDFFGINNYRRGIVGFSAANDFLHKGANSDYEKKGMSKFKIAKALLMVINVI